MYPEKTDICNCGIDIGLLIPRPELVTEARDLERNSQEWRMQLYGAALYWYCATMPLEKARDADVDLLRGKDVLEVACMRGGGSRYLAEVCGPRSYVATDFLEDHLEACRSRHADVPGLRFERADALELAETYPADSFDFVICIQAAAAFADLPRFVRGVHHVLRTGGRLILAEAVSRDKLRILYEAFSEVGFQQDAVDDLSRAVHAVGLCMVPQGISYLRIVAQKVPDAGSDWDHNLLPGRKPALQVGDFSSSAT